jgi:hypothetical protein
LSDDSIKVSLESKFDNKYRLERNTGENDVDKHRFDTLALTKQTKLMSPTSKDCAPQKQKAITVECVMPLFLIKTHLI